MFGSSPHAMLARSVMATSLSLMTFSRYRAGSSGNHSHAQPASKRFLAAFLSFSSSSAHSSFNRTAPHCASTVAILLS